MCARVCVCLRERERERERECVCVCVFGVHVPHCTPHWRGLCRRGARPVWRNKNKSPRPQACRMDYARTHNRRLRLRADAGCLRHCSVWNQPPTKDASDPDQAPAVPASIFSPAAASHPPRPAPHMRELMLVRGKCTRETEREHRRAVPMRCETFASLPLYL